MEIVKGALKKQYNSTSPLLSVKVQTIADPQEKANHFNKYFASQSNLYTGNAGPLSSHEFLYQQTGLSEVSRQEEEAEVNPIL